MHRALVSAALAAALQAASVPALAKTDVAPAAISLALPEARLAGAGELRWFGLRVYSASLWVGRPGLRIDRLASAPFALELRYATSLKGVAIAERSVQEIERMGFGDPSRRVRWAEAMKRLFPDVVRGDRLTGVHEPGRGARFFHNDRPIGAIDDPDFSDAFFAIWLDERTVAPSLREALLRQAAADSGGGQ
jgi:hypothetical protein